MAAGAIGLAVVNISTLVIAGRPWGVTAAFALWGSKIAMAAGSQRGRVAVLAGAGPRRGFRWRVCCAT